MLESKEGVGCLGRRERVGEWAGGSGGVRRGVGGGAKGRWQGEVGVSEKGGGGWLWQGSGWGLAERGVKIGGVGVGSKGWMGC